MPTVFAAPPKPTSIDLLRLTGVAYAWRKCSVSQRDWDDAHLINAAIDIHHDDPEFGYRFIADELGKAGVVASRNRVNRLCTLARLWSAHSRKRGLNRKPGPAGP